MASRISAHDWQRSIVILADTAVGVVVVSCLYWAQAVLVPLALAVFLTLVLAPVVAALQRRGLKRTPAVILVMVCVTLSVGTVTWVVTQQLVELANELPKYRSNITAKVRSLKELSTDSTTGRLGKLIDEVSKEIHARAPHAAPQAGELNDEAAAIPNVTDLDPDDLKSDQKSLPPQPVVVRSEQPTWFDQIPAALRSLGESLATGALSLVLVVFMLLKRERLRDRVLCLIGRGRLTATTKALEDAVQRIGRFLLAQLIVNGTYGVALAAGLFAMGIQYALVWGFLAAVLRYVPYLGAWIASAGPILISLVMFPGWLHPLLVIGLILMLELIVNNVIEPWLYGHSMGVSTVALLVAAALWAFLWGPIGLVLSSPLTVCLVVLGKYVPQFEFFYVLLGDQPALEPHVSFYQRLLARDQDEAVEIALAAAATNSTEAVFDSLIVPALSYARRDRQHDELSDRDEQFILNGVRETIEDLAERRLACVTTEAAEAAEARAASPHWAPVPLLAVPAHDEIDHLALEMLHHLLDPAKWDVRIVAIEMLASELTELAAAQKVSVVCIGSLPPGGLSHTRYVSKRLRASAPGMKILVGRWGLASNRERTKEQLLEAGADDVAWTLAETANRLAAWLPILAQEITDPGGSTPRRETAAA